MVQSNQHPINNSINIRGYQLFRRDHVTQFHGGVCIYLKNSIRCEVLWILLNRPHHLPGGFSRVIAGQCSFTILLVLKILLRRTISSLAWKLWNLSILKVH